MSQFFPDLFSPIRVGSYMLKNRIMNTGHAAHFQTATGVPTQRYADYVGERARGGAGVIVIGHTVVAYDGPVPLSLSSVDDEVVPIYRKMADATHAYEVPLLVQMGHRGRRVADPGAFLGGRVMNAASAVPPPDFSVAQHMPHEMSTSEMEGAVDLFRQATSRAQRGGLDGVELAVGMDLLLANTLNPQANRRQDKYGGETIEERMTFLREVVDAVRGELGSDRLVGIRFYDDLVEYSLTVEDYKVIGRLLEADGTVDYFNMWQGIVPSFKSGRAHWPSYYYQPGQFANLPAALKSAVSLPVVGTGRMDSPAVADRVINQGKADIIGMARTLIADPHFPNKAREGRTEDIRPCIACTQSCVGHIYLGMGVGCIYNPVTGREAEWADLDKAPARKKVVVVGGGPGGMEAARTAAERGHEVVLLERSSRLGGQIRLIVKTPNRGNFEEIILFFERQLAKLGVEVRLRTEADAETVLAEQPDVIVIATGSTAYIPEVIGTGQRHVLSARDVLEGNADIGNRVLVVDTIGRAEAATTADYIAELGRQVEIVTGLPYVAQDMPVPSWHNLTEELLNKNVTLTPFTGVWEVNENSVDVYNVINWAPRTIEEVDTVVFGSGGRADDALYRTLEQRHDSVYAIGDCYQPRDIELAVTDGHRVAREI